MLERRPRGRGIIIAIAAAALAFALLFFALDMLEKRDRKPETRGDLQARYADQTVTLNGKTYRRRQNLTAVLLLGIDQLAGDADESDFQSGGNADFLRLIVIDPAEKTVSQIQIDRDTVTPIAVLNLIGQRTDTKPMQIALSHSYGDGKETSCELTAEAVSRLLLEMPVQYYAAMSLDGIAALNDFAGGVTVPVDDDFSGADSGMIQGTTMRLTGKQAEIFVRSRADLPVSTNEARMARQQIYLEGLIGLVHEKLEDDPDYMGALFDALSPYLTTNMTRSQMISLAYRVREYLRPPLIQIPGTREISAAGYMEFHPDEQALAQIVADVFCQTAE
ncbi:MAG: LCP family protein [Clostridia bacterium]|nr:LCP family protein [Clostridia bacterium]